jgi:two-component system, LytTR family, response regulator
MSRAIAEYEELLPSDFFFRTHRSYLVNCRFIDTISKEAMVVNLDNNEALPVGRRRLAELLQFLKKFKVADA